MTLNLFFAMQPHGDRWVKYDHYPREFIRRLIRGKPKVFGLERTFLNLCAGLDKIGVQYRVNDYKYIKKHPEELACIIGTPYLLNREWKNPVIFGPAGHSHPSDAPDLFSRFDIQKVLVYGPWMKEMCEPFWNGKVAMWPVGIDTDLWSPADSPKEYDFIVYDKIMWDYERQKAEFLTPILSELERCGLKTAYLRYGSYDESAYLELLRRSKAMLFLCEHETQGIAYQQALSCNVPVLAWEQGMWLDPKYYPRIKHHASSVPYWDERCGVKFKDLSEFEAALNLFLDQRDTFLPRRFVTENLTLGERAKSYLSFCL
jgi:hypothetical protein